MKKNLSNIKTLAILLTAGAIMTACTNDELVEPGKTGKTYTLSVNAISAGANGSTRALSLDGKTLNAAWATDENVYVVGSWGLEGTLSPQSNGASAMLTGTIDRHYHVGDKISLIYPRAELDYSGQKGTLADIAANYNFATATAIAKGYSYDEYGEHLNADNGSGGPVVFENQQAIVKFTLVNKADGEPLNASQLIVKAGSAAYDVTPEAPTSELFVAIPGFSGKDVTVEATVGDAFYTYVQKGVTFENSQYYTVTVKMTQGENPYAIPLTFEAKTAGAKLEFNPSENMESSAEYSTDGITWNTYELGTVITCENVGDKVSFRANNAYRSQFYTFWDRGEWYLYGNVMSLVSSTGYATATELTEESAFEVMFIDNQNLYNHPDKKIVLPATKLSPYCYHGMFYGCTNLTEAPELPATTLKNGCYMGMFEECTSLTEAPELSATTLESGCYAEMFQGCTSLIKAPELPATTLESGCYEEMFQGCTSLTTAPELPATTLTDLCYYEMFSGCISLTEAPELPATTLRGYCYYRMFQDCISLNSVKCLATDIPANNECTTDWLSGVAATGTFTKAAGMEWPSGASGIPEGWTVVEDGAGAEDFNPYSTPLTFEAKTGDAVITFSAMNGLASPIEYSTDGTTWNTYTEAIVLANAGDKVSFRGNNGYVCGEYQQSHFGVDGEECYIYGNIMSLINSNDFATATTLTRPFAFGYLFRYTYGICSHPSKKLVLPATTLTRGCYAYLFSGTGLSVAPELPATTLAESCYTSMFFGCDNLTKAPDLPATTLENYCYSDMFNGCEKLTTAPVLPAKTLRSLCYAGMFQNCFSLKSVKCLATDISASQSTFYWLEGVAATGTFTKAAGVEWPTGNSGIPEGWTVVEE